MIANKIYEVKRSLNSVFDAINFVRAICSDGLGAVNTVTSTINGLKQYSGIVASGFEILGVLPEEVDAEEAINDAIDTVNGKLSSSLMTLKNSIKGVSGYVDTLFTYIEKSIRNVTDYIESVENAIRSTINKYTSIIYNCIFSINKQIAKIQNTINRVINGITMLPTLMLENTMNSIRHSIDPTGKRFKATSKLLQPVISNVMSSITSNTTSALSGITNSFNKVFDKVHRITDFLISKMSKVNGNLLRYCYQ